MFIGVFSRCSSYSVIAAFSINCVITIVLENVITIATINNINFCSSINNVITRTTIKSIVAVISFYRVITISTLDFIVSATS